MSEISDEILMAYADAELSSADRQRVEAYLAETPTAALRLQAFIETRRELATVFDAAISEPMPARLLRGIYDTPFAPEPKPAPSRQQRSIRWLGALAPLRPAYTSWQGAIAFGSVLLAGAGVGWKLHSTQWQSSSLAPLIELSETGLVAGRGLQLALDTIPSGKREAIGAATGKMNVKPTFTFAQNDGDYCRQFEIQQPDGQRFASVACRNVDGRWRIEVYAPAVGQPRNANGGVVPAGTQLPPVVDGAVDRIIKGDVLGVDAEMKLIANNWHSERK